MPRLGLVLVIDLLILGALWLRRDPLPQAPPVELLAAVDEPRSEPATPDPESDRLLAAVLGGGEDAEEAWQRLRTGDEPWVPAARARLAAGCERDLADRIEFQRKIEEFL